MTLYYNKPSAGNLVDSPEAVPDPPEAVPDSPDPIPPGPPSARTTVRRRAGRARYDRRTIDAILDEGLVGHVAFAAHGQPYAIPMLYARRDDHVYLHGSPLSRLVGGLADGIPICLTVTLLDGLVLARSAFHHSINYRSAVVLGAARVVRDRDQKLDTLRAIVERVMPGRSDDVRGPSDAELEATEVVGLSIEEASAKLRTGPPVDATGDYALRVWAGELPLRLAAGVPSPDPRCEVPVPDYVNRYALARG
jgi:nitroimidazol reductase NimA-like FMN-containing flavoprotein (pyridoxamine 5'-phosphate oxidase superfamily)